MPEIIPERNDSMQLTNKTDKIRTVMWLLLIYTGSVIVRYLLALATRNCPTVWIDEFLYYSLGRSIATEGSLLYLGQPAVYNYIVYPLILAPVYLLFGHGTDFFRVIELWNIILISLSVFPFYALCKAMVQKSKTALWLTGLFMLLPQFILGEFIYSEAIIYPMFYTLMYCIYRYLKKNEIKHVIWIGILGAVLYYTKPGAVIPAVVSLLLFASKAVKQKSRKAAIYMLAGTGCLTAVFFLIKILTEQVLGYQGSLLGVYDDQVVLSFDGNIEFFINALSKYPYYFVLAGGVLPLLVSLWHYSEYEQTDRQYYILLFFCSLLTMVGVAWVVNRPEKQNLLYLKYVEMYLPILLLYIAVPTSQNQESSGHLHKIPEILSCTTLVYVTVSTVVWGCTTGLGKSFESHFFISLATLLVENSMGIANIIIVFLAGLTLYLLVKKEERKTVAKVCCMLMILLTLMNNIMGYITTGKNTDRKLMDETMEIHQRIGEREYIHVYTEDQNDYGLDINSTYNIFRITDYDFFENIRQNNGVYSSFIPSSARGMKAVYQTPDTDMMIIDEKIYKQIKLSDWTFSFISADNSFQVVTLTPNERMVDCTLQDCSNSTYSLSIYNDDWLQHPITIRLEIESKTDQIMNITASKQFTVPVREGKYWYELKFQTPVNELLISMQEDSAKIDDFEIVTD